MPRDSVIRLERLRAGSVELVVETPPIGLPGSFTGVRTSVTSWRVT